MAIIITGCAGFIGYHTATSLLATGQMVIGIDNLNDYYDVNLKLARLTMLKQHAGFIFIQADISDRDLITQLLAPHISTVKTVIHLAAQAGVRYSLEQPFKYVDSNIQGLLVMLELCRSAPHKPQFVFASSSSVYGANASLPFSVQEKTLSPLSFYAATKIAGEAICYSYSSLYNIPITSLRFFTVYGPWNRPDMAIYQFSQAIVSGQPISLYNHGDMKRDFTFIGDIVSGILGSLRPPTYSHDTPYRIYNLGNNQNVSLRYFVSLLEEAIGKQAIILEKPMQAGDMQATLADITEAQNDLGFTPSVTIEEGIPQFVQWFKSWNNIA